jgi:hypothetical protein
MDGLALIRRAQDAGLRLQAAGTALKITGPKRAEPLVRLLMEHKTQVLEGLRLVNGEQQKMQEMQKIPHGGRRGYLPQPDEEEADRFDERADAGLPRKAEAIASFELAGRPVCAQCGAEDDGKLHNYGGTLLHEQCSRFRHPTTAVGREGLNDQWASNQLGTYEQVFAALRSQCPQLIEPDRWQQAIQDADSFLATWGAQAHALGWTARELFGLHAVPERPAATYKRLSRYDETGLIWLLQGKPVIGLTESEAAIRGHSGATVVYRKHNKPALGPLGDSLDDLGGHYEAPST